jgi:FKBP-type peptidyl-prolyl cis-trans isomerase SlyD
MNISKDRVVSIGYTLKSADNQILDSAPDSEPLVYLHGHENIIPGLEKALEGKAVGDTVDVILPAAEAYGERDEALVAEISLDRFEGAEVEEGMQFEAQTNDGYRVVTVTGISDGKATVDGNHPLAGMELNFNVTIADIREASNEELAHGHVHGHHHENCDGCGACGGDDGYEDEGFDDSEEETE